MPKYEVRMVYTGCNTYLVEADSREDAENKAFRRYENGEEGEHTGAEWEDVMNVNVYHTEGKEKQ